MEAQENEFALETIIIKEEKDFDVLCEVKEEVDVTYDDNIDHSGTDNAEIKPIKLEQIIDQSVVEHIYIKIEEPCEVDNSTDGLQSVSRISENASRVTDTHVAGSEDTPIELKECTKKHALKVNLERCPAGLSGYKLFTGEKGLKDYLSINTEHKPIKCNQCNKSFTRNSHLKRHVAIHTGIKPFKCNECNKNFTQKGDLTRHTAMHTGYKPFECNECNKSFTQKSNFLSHMAMHTGYKPFKCNECDTSFTRNSHLKSHMAIHTAHKPFKCNECNKSFTRNSNLKSHMVIHATHKPFNCNECNKSFTRKFNLKSHMAIHTGQKINIP